MYKLTVVGLDGCSLCDGLCSKLVSGEIPFHLVNARDHNKLCDMLEALLRSTKYPMVTFELPTRVYFICIPEDADRLGWKVLDDTSTSVGVLSVDEIFNIITQLISKI